MVHHLSELTPAVVNALYHIDSATPRPDPAFVLMIGAPGAGKSSGHAAAIEAGYLPAGDYATINLDILLESMLPFRAASSMAHLLKQRHREMVKFASIPAYGSKKENLGMFKWYNTAHGALQAAEPNTIAAFNTVRAQWPAPAPEAAAPLTALNEAAIHEAIKNRVPIVYETTASVGKDGRVAKADAIAAALEGTPYRLVVMHVTGKPADIAERVKARQEHGMPAEALPYYRMVPSMIIADQVKGNAAAFAALQAQYAGLADFIEVKTPHNKALLAKNAGHSFEEQRARIMAAYAAKAPSPPSSWRPSSWRRITIRRKPSSSWRPSSWKKRRTSRALKN
jgi:hypothetical protein